MHSASPFGAPLGGPAQVNPFMNAPSGFPAAAPAAGTATPTIFTPSFPAAPAAPVYRAPTPQPAAEPSVASIFTPNPSDVFTSAIAGQVTHAGLALGTSALARYLPGVALFWENLRFYFAVNNSYVVNKLKILGFPFKQERWSREYDQVAAGPAAGSSPYPTMPGAEATAGSVLQPRPPMLDVNAPDLYLPMMSFVTFVLLSGLYKGTQQQFTPDSLYNVFSSCVVLEILEVGGIWAALYLHRAPQLSLFDIVALAGYKFVGLVAILLAALLLGSWGFYGALLYTSACAAKFIIANLTELLPQPSMSEERQQSFIVLGIGGLQFVLMLWMASIGSSA